VDDDPVLLEVKEGVAVLSLNLPDKHNVAGEAVDALFFRYLDLLRTDRDVRVVVWRGNGPSFSAGRDLGDLGTHRSGNGHLPTSDFEMLERTAWSTRLLAEYPVPIVCALKGWTLGTMLERALLCDIRVAGEGAKLALPGLDHGVIPDAAGVAKLVEIGGAALALDLALTGRRIDAAEALRLGLVSQVVPDDELDEVVLDLARGLAARPPLAVRLVRESVQALVAAGIRGTLGRELVGQTMVLASHDYREHRLARAEDREPRYERR
jgi:enoyl-CoA hydratase